MKDIDWYFGLRKGLKIICGLEIVIRLISFYPYPLVFTFSLALRIPFIFTTTNKRIFFKYD